MGIVMPSIFARASAMHKVDYNSDDDSSDSSDDVYCFFKIPIQLLRKKMELAQPYFRRRQMLLF